MDSVGEGGPTSASRFHQSIWIVLVAGTAIGGVMAALTLAWPSGRGANAALTPIPERAAVGEPAPDFVAETISGKTIHLRYLQGSPVALNFWATWCAPCRVEMPELERASRQYADAGLIVLGVNAGETPDQARTYFAELNLTFDSALDQDMAIVNLYGIRAFPTTIWIDANGVIRAKHLGPLSREAIDLYMIDLIAQPKR